MLFLGVGDVRACSIPVFRYALERWELTPYELFVFHDGPLTDAQKAWLGKIERGQPPANVHVRRVPIGEPMTKIQQRVFDKQGKGRALPWAALRLADADASVAWTGPLDEAAIQLRLDSPARRKVVDRLKTGETATFLLLTSGNAEADDAAEAMLAKELRRLEKAIALPELTEDGPQLRTGLPLKVAFSILRVDRNDPAERGFVDLLLSSEEGLDAVQGPIAMPIFGRGRLLCSIYGDDLAPKQVADVCRFLCGACSCQVKELNPGVDLVFSANWTALLEAAGPPAVARPDRPSAKTKKQP